MPLPLHSTFSNQLSDSLQHFFRGSRHTTRSTSFQLGRWRWKLHLAKFAKQTSNATPEITIVFSNCPTSRRGWGNHELPGFSPRLSLRRRRRAARTRIVTTPGGSFLLYENSSVLHLSSRKHLNNNNHLGGTAGRQTKKSANRERPRNGKLTSSKGKRRCRRSSVVGRLARLAYRSPARLAYSRPTVTRKKFTSAHPSPPVKGRFFLQ